MGQLRKLKRQIESLEGEGAAGGGMVKVRMNGARQVRRVTIDPEVVRSGDVELLEDLVKAAIMTPPGRSSSRCRKGWVSIEELGQLTGGK